MPASRQPNDDRPARPRAWLPRPVVDFPAAGVGSQTPRPSATTARPVLRLGVVQAQALRVLARRVQGEAELRMQWLRFLRRTSTPAAAASVRCSGARTTSTALLPVLPIVTLALRPHRHRIRHRPAVRCPSENSSPVCLCLVRWLRGYATHARVSVMAQSQCFSAASTRARVLPDADLVFRRSTRDARPR